MQQMVANVLLADPSPDPGIGVKRSKFNFFRTSVTYQIEWSHNCSNMVANILPAGPSPPLSKGQNSTFSEHGMLHIKFKGVTHAATW